jgi:hypothetical protein
MLANGGLYSADFVSGADGLLYGGGGSGITRWNPASPGGTGTAAGKNGAAGIVIITEYLAS